jgi:lipoprotein-anchoring transpeptidase ErfK/SrfK
MTRMKILLALPLALAGAAALAQTALKAVPPAPPAAASEVRTTGRGSEPKIERLVTEDDNVRIEELRVRGQTQRLTVRSKVPGMPTYDVVPTQGGIDPLLNQSAGQRVWWSLPF